MPSSSMALVTTVCNSGEEAAARASPPQHVTALLGQDVILHCPFEYPDGIPVPYLVQWHKKEQTTPIYIWYDGYPPHAADEYRDRISLSGQSSLNLTNVCEGDKGWYACKVFYLSRETIHNGTWIYLDVLAPPHFKAKPEQVIYVEVGESVVLPCEAEGTPAPAITWYKDNLPVEEAGNIQIDPTGLRINNLRHTDVGNYMCMACNTKGCDSVVAKVVAAVAARASPPQQVSATSSEPEHVTAFLGQDVILHCPFEYPDGISVPYLVEWHKKDQKTPIYIWYNGYPPHAADEYRDRISLSNQSSLNLTDVHEGDKGWYECKVLFLNRETIHNGTWIYLDVLVPPHFKAKPKQVIYVKIGESVVLPCEAEGNPTPAIIWYKDNLPLEEAGNIRTHPTELHINNLQQTDLGDYMCMALNSEGSVSVVAKVIVAGPAVIVTPPHNLTKLEGNFAELVCEAKALPSNITHRWFYSGVEISKLTWLQTRTLVRQDGTLFINPTAATDSGFYTCEISNGIGTPESAMAYLNIEYPARVNFTPAFQYLPLNLSGTVRCYIQANPPIQFVTWFKDSRPFDANSMNGVVNLSNGSLFFQRVSYEHQGRYLCSPFNIHSTGGSSQIMEVLVREPPLFSVKPKQLYQQSENTEVIMPCEGKGHPPPTVSWRRVDAKKLPKNRHSVNKGKLTIKSLQKEDHGRYECVLQNDVATLVTSTLLLVEKHTL